MTDLGGNDADRDHPTKIKGYVAQILTTRELAINRGTSHGVEPGMRFAVLNPRGVAIKDPETGEDLGGIDVPKVLVKVVRVAERLCVASTFRTYKSGGGPLRGMSYMGDLYAKPTTYYETLKTNESTYQEELTEEDSYVRIGDPVVEYKEGDFEGWRVNR